MSSMNTTDPDTNDRSATFGASATSIRCPITGYLCKGDLSYLCEDYGCARKGGLSPHSNENF
jgi:hypothetical protein